MTIKFQTITDFLNGKAYQDFCKADILENIVAKLEEELSDSQPDTVHHFTLISLLDWIDENPRDAALEAIKWWDAEENLFTRGARSKNQSFLFAVKPFNHINFDSNGNPHNKW